MQLLHLHHFIISHLLNLHLTLIVRQLRIEHNLENLVAYITQDFRAVADAGLKNTYF